MHLVGGETRSPGLRLCSTSAGASDQDDLSVLLGTATEDDDKASARSERVRSTSGTNFLYLVGTSFPVLSVKSGYPVLFARSVLIRDEQTIVPI